jgi:hypothetical protein
MLMMELAALVLLGMTFLAAGITKVITTDRFRAVVGASPIADGGLRERALGLLPYFECLLGVWLLSALAPTLALAVTLGVVTAFAVYRVALHIICPECGCGCGLKASAVDLRVIVIESGSLIALCAVGLWASIQTPSTHVGFHALGILLSGCVGALGLRRARQVRAHRLKMVDGSNGSVRAI